MREPGLQGNGKNEATVTSNLTLMPLVIANKRRVSVAVLSPTTRCWLRYAARLGYQSDSGSSRGRRDGG